MTDLRYALALILVIIMPVVITFWLTIHAAHPFWKRQPVWLAYTCAGVLLSVVAVACFWNRALLIGTDLGLLWPLFLAGAFIYAVSLRMSAPVRHVLAFKTFAGVAQLNNDDGALLAEGPYAAIRHPRYFMVLVGVVGWAMMANFAGAYITALVSIAGMVLVVRLEERELVARFGEAYENYKQQVPQLIPRRGDLGLLF
ncbi:MAG: isoprenylcysteine carboxylmethyltransferase family protein [Pseudomonadota bacterium]